MVVAGEEGRLQRYALTAMRMAFREGADLGDVTKVLEAGERVGLDPAALGARMADPRTKAGLRELTDGASALGVDGIPTVLVGDRRFWGDDRLEEAAAAAMPR
jgi:2-hydroxychromene-2-carboxylate isomerase